MAFSDEAALLDALCEPSPALVARIGEVLHQRKLLEWLAVLREELLRRLLVLAQRGLLDEGLVRAELLQLAHVELELLLLDLLLLLLAHLVEEAEVAELVRHAVPVGWLGPWLSCSGSGG